MIDQQEADGAAHRYLAQVLLLQQSAHGDHWGARLPALIDPRASKALGVGDVTVESTHDDRHPFAEGLRVQAFLGHGVRLGCPRDLSHVGVTAHRSSRDLDTCRHAGATGRFNRQLTSYLRPAVPVVDEVGYLPLDRAEANMVFQLVPSRHERGSMIITSNKSFAEWGQVLGDDVLATAILDRFLHHCDVPAINGPSYRLKDRLALVPGGDPMP
ncbi:ATP-binding protein [Aeromicrobium sp.]|uniref:ATP-binding protein n=1 Tax=Aeromicrobium sp. TaxID=1871063 RepID=UPI0019B75274|nr:ATP-binding protein [Aeromicrobium sp.]MBC7633572.1 ATP-binding protein [Aeromicrobium sp.]